jgi:hypothetical protein
VSFERREIGPDRYVLVSEMLERGGFLAAFSERTGGKSSGPYRSLNLSFGVDDEADHVRENRAAVAGELGTASWTLPEQVHGARAVRVGAKRAGLGFEEDSSRVSGADALFTKSAGLPLAVLTADCMPIVMGSATDGMVATVHVGWRGLADGLLPEVMAQFPDPSTVRAAIGPAIGPCHYEVGEDVALAVSAGLETGAVTDRRAGRLYLDLVGTARRELRALGIRNVEDTGLCTACESKRFFSHRRDDGITGRQAGIGMRIP